MRLAPSRRSPSPRYRVLFNTLLSGADDVEDGLVVGDAPWAGSCAFGLCFSDGAGGVAGVGTRLLVREHAQLDGGRMAVNARGLERFRIIGVVARAPVVTARVEILSDGPDATSPEAAAAADAVRASFRALLAKAKAKKPAAKASAKGKAPAGKRGAEAAPATVRLEVDVTALGAKLAPAPLSYWIATYMADSPAHQQALLQEDSTVARLGAALAVLQGTVSFLRAKAAVEALSLGSEGGGGEAAPPPGGPD